MLSVCGHQPDAGKTVSEDTGQTCLWCTCLARWIDCTSSVTVQLFEHQLDAECLWMPARQLH